MLLETIVRKPAWRRRTLERRERSPTRIGPSPALELTMGFWWKLWLGKVAGSNLASMNILVLLSSFMTSRLGSKFQNWLNFIIPAYHTPCDQSSSFQVKLRKYYALRFDYNMVECIRRHSILNQVRLISLLHVSLFHGSKLIVAVGQQALLCIFCHVLYVMLVRTVS